MGPSPVNRPNAAPRFSVYSNASQLSTTSIRESSRLRPIVETRSNFVSWSVAATNAATATSAGLALSIGTEHLLALDQRLALDTVGNVGERFEPLFANRFTAALARAVITFVHAFQRGVDLGQNLLQVLRDRNNALGF